MDHAKKALSRVYWQYRNAPKLNQWMRILPDLAQVNLEDQLAKIISLLDIDEARGQQLDVIGRIAGINRPRIRVGVIRAFAYNGTPEAQAYGTGPYKSEADQIATVILPDYLFRIMVRAKIMQNNGIATIDDVKRSVDFIFNTDCSVTDGQNMTMSVIWLENEVPANFKALVDEYDIIPRPQGVKASVNPVKYYAFAYKGTLKAQPYDTNQYATPI